MTVNEKEINEILASFGASAAKLIELTLIDADRFIEEINSALQTGDTSNVSLAAHSLKSIMKQIGAFSVSDIAFEIETAGKSGDAKECIAKWPALEENYKETREHLTFYTGA